MIRRFHWLILTLWLGLPAGARSQEGEALPELSRHPYVQLTTPSSAVIVWRTNGPSDPVLRWGEAPGALVNEVLDGLVRLPPKNLDDEGEIDPPEGEEPLRLSSAPPNTHQYEWTVTGLEPASRYHYAIYDGDRKLAGDDDEHFFRTSPRPGAPADLRFWVVGDSGDGQALQRASFAAIQQRVGDSGKAIDAYLHLGDMAYTTGRDQEFSDHFFAIYTPLLRQTVVWPTMGNHEGYSASGPAGIGPYYDAYAVPTRGEAGGLASGTESYYAFDYGPVHFVCLNSHDEIRSPEGAMAQWLREDLSQTQAAWLIAFFHHPPYTKGTHDSDYELQLVEMREHIVPILESHGVDLILAGHSHTYERSMLIDGAYATPTVVDGVVIDDGDGDPAGQGAYLKSENLHPHEGTVAVVAGNGRWAAQVYGLMPVMRRTVPETGSLLLDLEGDRITGRMVNHLNAVRDRFQIIKSGAREPRERLQHPWRPFGPRVMTASIGSGQLKIVLAPDPPAPDAELRYTLDGSAVADDSPLYTEPLIVRQDVLLQARSTWRQGTRTSPVTRTGWLRTGDPHHVRVPILHGEDDGVLIEGEVKTGGSVLPLDGGMIVLRFRDVQVPAEATIGRAYLQFAAAAPVTAPGNLLVFAGGGASPPPLADPEHPLQDRPWTEGAVLWPLSPDPAVGGLWPRQTPDLSGILQEWIETSGWVAGDDFVLALRGEAATAVAGVGAFEAGSGKAPVLVLEYEPLSPRSAAIAQAPWVVRTPGGALEGSVTRVSYRRLSGYAARDFHYQLEVSADLTSDSWKPLDGWERVAPPQPEEGAWQVETHLHRGELEKRLFIRVRVTGTDE